MVLIAFERDMDTFAAILSRHVSIGLNATGETVR